MKYDYYFNKCSNIIFSYSSILFYLISKIALIIIEMFALLLLIIFVVIYTIFCIYLNHIIFDKYNTNITNINFKYQLILQVTLIEITYY